MKQTIVLVVAAMILWPAMSVAGEGKAKGDATEQSTTVKSSKSNTNDWVSGGATGEQPRPISAGGGERGTTVKGSKSNTSE